MGDGDQIVAASDAPLPRLRVEEARDLLAECRTIDEAKDLADQAEAMRVYLRRKGAAAGALADCWEITQHAIRRMGALSAALPQAKPGRKKKMEADSAPISKGTQLQELGVSNRQARHWQNVAALSDAEFSDRIQAGRARIVKRGDDGSELTATSSAANYDGDEWYTPADYIEAARKVLGGIDVDPASNAYANKTVKAERFYTKQDSSLTEGVEWAGRVWMNPPYSYPLVEHFCQRFVFEVEAKHATAGIVLVNNCTDAAWFHAMLERFPVCFTRGRIPFESRGSQKFQTRQGQAFFYAGKKVATFRNVFSQYGAVLVRA